MNESCAPEPCCNQTASIEAYATKQDICRPMTLTERLVSRKCRLESELNSVNAALNSLNSNPELADAINNITQVFGDRIH